MSLLQVIALSFDTLLSALALPVGAGRFGDTNLCMQIYPPTKKKRINHRPALKKLSSSLREFIDKPARII